MTNERTARQEIAEALASYKSNLNIVSFEDAMLLTRNEGLVVRTGSPMDAANFVHIIEEACGEYETDLSFEYKGDFESYGMMTNNYGAVIEIGGTEFYLEIVEAGSSELQITITS